MYNNTLHPLGAERMSNNKKTKKSTDICQVQNLYLCDESLNQWIMQGHELRILRWRWLRYRSRKSRVMCKSCALHHDRKSVSREAWAWGLTGCRQISMHHTHTIRSTRWTQCMWFISYSWPDNDMTLCTSRCRNDHFYSSQHAVRTAVSLWFSFAWKVISFRSQDWIR